MFAATQATQHNPHGDSNMEGDQPHDNNVKTFQIVMKWFEIQMGDMYL